MIAACRRLGKVTSGQRKARTPLNRVISLLHSFAPGRPILNERLMNVLALALGFTNQTFSFQYPPREAFLTFCSPSRRFNAVPTLSRRFRSCAAKSFSPTTTAPDG